MNSSTRRYGICYIIVLSVFFFFSLNASAVKIGAGPSTLYFTDLLKGGYGETAVVVSTPGEDELDVTVTIEGEISDWIKITPNRFKLAAKSNQELLVIIRPPADASNGNYYSEIQISAAPLSAVKEGMGLALGGGIVLPVLANVTGREVKNYRVIQIKAEDTEVGYPLNIEISLENTGNVRLEPKFNIEVFNEDKSLSINKWDFTGNTLLPLRQFAYETTMETELMRPGAYVTRISVYNDDGSMTELAMMSFNLLKAGTLFLDGVLKDVIMGQKEVAVGKSVKITGVFANVGSFPTSAKLQCEVQSQGELLTAFESDELRVDKGATVNLETYYTPNAAGEQTIKCSATYAKKKTQGKELELTVTGGTSPLVYIIIMVVLLLIVGGGIYYKKYVQ